MTRINVLLLLVLVAFAVSLVTSRHQARKRFVELERAQAEARAYDTEYGQLSLEQSTWGSPGRVEKIAREQLQMQLPDAGRVQVMAPGAIKATVPGVLESALPGMPKSNAPEMLKSAPPEGGK